MYLNAMRMRLMWVGAVAFLLLFALYWGGPSIFGTGTAVSIEWGIEPNLVGSRVEIDGKDVGKLENFGQATRTAFPASAGEHTVRVIAEAFDCPPYKIELKRGERRHLLLDIEDTVDAKGGTKPRLTFRN